MPPPLPDKLDEILEVLAYELIHSVRQAIEDGWTSEESMQIQNAKIAEAYTRLNANYIPKSHLEPLLEEEPTKSGPVKQEPYIPTGPDDEHIQTPYKSITRVDAWADGRNALKQEIRKELL